MHNNEMIKQEFLQYIARLLEASPLTHAQKPEAARHDVVALLAEQALTLSVKEDNTKDLYILKPFIRAVLIIIEERLVEIVHCDIYMPEIEALKENYVQTRNTLEELLKNLN